MILQGIARSAQTCASFISQGTREGTAGMSRGKRGGIQSVSKGKKRGPIVGHVQKSTATDVISPDLSVSYLYLVLSAYSIHKCGFSMQHFH